MGLANKSVVLYQNVKIKTEWKFQEVVGDPRSLCTKRRTL